MCGVLETYRKCSKSWLYLFLTLTLMSSCSGVPDNKKQKDISDNRNDYVYQTVTKAAELPFPVPPDSLTEPEERAAFVAGHFWDTLDFRSREAVDTAFMEQNFANFLGVIAMTPRDGAYSAIGNLLSKAAVNPEAAELLDGIVDKYLDDPNSPMRDEEIYILFLENVRDGEGVSSEKRERAVYRLGQAMKNRRGTTATDFHFVTRDGERTTLLNSLGDGMTLLMFYDPDCEQCAEAKELLEKTPLQPGVKILAIDVAADRELWDKTKDKMPREWITGFATDPIDDEELYVLPALPTFYLLDPNGTILLKDPPLQQLIIDN